MANQIPYGMDLRLAQALDDLGMLSPSPIPLVPRPHDRELVQTVAERAHAEFSTLYESLDIDLPGDSAIRCDEFAITGAQDNPIRIQVFEPHSIQTSLPCIVYFHGGAMTILDAFASVHQRWCQDLANAGSLVVNVEFRNAYVDSGLNPFPLGLMDCLCAVQWLNENRSRLGFEQLILQGESGGGNLAICTALMAKSCRQPVSIDGVYAVVPYISGAYGWAQDRKRAELPSLIENDGYFINCSLMDLLASAYDPQGENARNPHCWPYHANKEDLTGLPPHVITVSEFDPLRDEGLAFHRKLLAAGVKTRASCNYGLTHAAELIFRKSLPDWYFSRVSDITEFALSASRQAPG